MSPRGFTLIEVMLTMSLLALVALLASPFSGRFIFTQEVPVVQDEIEGSLRQARLLSIAGKNDTAWSVIVSDQQIILFQGSDFGGRDQAFDQVFDLHPQVAVTGLEEAVTFAQRTGLPSVQPTITLSGYGTTHTLGINSQGVVDEQ